MRSTSMSPFYRVAIFCLCVPILNGLAYGAGDVTTAGRLGITSSTAEASSGSPLFLNVKDYGVVGDGVTDDKPAITALLATLTSGGHIHFPAGTYLIKNGNGSAPPNTIVSSNIMITGDGSATIFAMIPTDGVVPNNAGSENWNLFQANTMSNITIANVSWSGYGSFIRFSHCTNVVLDNLHGEGLLANAGSYLSLLGMFFNNTSGVRITNSYFHNFRSAIYLSGAATTESRQFLITNNAFVNDLTTFNALFPASVYVFYGRDNIISHNTFKNIYSSFNDGTYATGMGYGVYEGDGQSIGLTISDNSFEFTGNGTHNATAILVGSDTNTVIRGNNLRSTQGRMIYGVRRFFTLTGSNSLISNNVISMEAGEVLVNNFAILVGPGSGVATKTNNVHVSGNAIAGPWYTGIRVESEAYARVMILNNSILGSTARQIMVIGTGSNSLQQPIIRGNRLMAGQTEGINVQFTVGAIVENNTILDGNLSALTGDSGAAIHSSNSGHGLIIRNNILGNTPTGGGLFTRGIVMSGLTSTIFKNLIYGNSLIGFNLGSTVYTNVPTASPTTTFFDIDFGDIIYNSALAAGGVPAWVCTKATLHVLTADASNASTTVTVASTTGYVAGDLVMLTKSNSPYATEFDNVNDWHATTIASVTDATNFVLTTAIPVGDGTFVSGTGYVKRALFKPFGVIGS